MTEHAERMSTATTLTFLGGAGTVTGSRFLVEHGDIRLLIDCGLFQGLRELRRRNWEPFPVDPASVDAVVVTHAHLDHSGYLPALARDGFAGRVVCTPDTAALAAIVLRDSARLQEEDAAYASSAGFSKHSPPRPLYTSADAEHALSLFTPANFGELVELAPDMSVVLRPAGHVLGSSTAELRVAGRTALFTGDLGRSSHPLLRPPARPPAADVVVTESTYGNRAHPEADVDTFADVLRRTLGRGGVVLIPSFAVDRTEIVLHTLRLLMTSGAVPHVPVFVDSPMALETLAVYRQALHDRHADVRPEAADEEDFFDTGDLRVARTSTESQRLNQPGFPCVLVSASGMATGGRVVHHLKQLLPDKKNSVVLAGYQAVGTRGRDLVDGARQVKIHGKYVRVHAEVVNLLQFSVHADAGEIVDWLSQLPAQPETCYVVHGEPDASRDLRDRIADELGWLCIVPDYLERVCLD
jgi:metallo-beta-lactamase family protein